MTFHLPPITESVVSTGQLTVFLAFRRGFFAGISNSNTKDSDLHKRP